jgi:hypothetical protein
MKSAYYTIKQLPGRMDRNRLSGMGKRQCVVLFGLLLFDLSSSVPGGQFRQTRQRTMARGVSTLFRSDQFMTVNRLGLS